MIRSKLLDTEPVKKLKENVLEELDSEDSLNSDEEEELENERIGNDEWCVWGKNAKQWRHNVIPRVFAAKKPTKLKKYIFKEEEVYIIIYLIALH